MTAPAASAEPTGRNRRRIKLVLRLGLLLGGPFLVLFAIFAAGVYTGATNPEGVVGFEAKWLGMQAGPDVGETSGDPTGDEPAKTEPAKTEPAKTEPAKPEPVKPEPVKTTEPTKPEPVKLEPTKAEVALPVALPEPLPAEFADAVASTRILRVKLMVDPALLVTHREWLSYVDELLRSTSASFEVLFGLSLRLHGVVLWEPAGSTSDALLADLAGRQREGADLIVGLAARPMLGDPPARREDGVVLVFAALDDTRDRFHRPLLRSLAASFGAEPIRERESVAWRRGSFMSDAPVSPDTPPWIDPDNRARVLRNKWSRPPVAEPSP